MKKPLPSASTYAGWLAIFRMLTGVIWLSHAVPKFTKSEEFMPPNGFITMYVSQGLQHTSGFFHTFIVNVVQPNLALFAELVRLGELLTGIALLFGVLTRLGGLGGMLLTLSYLAARESLFSSATLQSLDFPVFVLSAISFVLPTGRVLGVDALFARTRPAPATVRAEFVPEPPITPPPPAPEPPPAPSTPAGPSMPP